MFPGPTGLRSIGCLTESIWTPRSKSKQKAECTPKEGTNENLLSAKKDPPQDSSDPSSLGEPRIGSELCFIRRQETDAKQLPKPNSVFSREVTRWHSFFQHQETGAIASLRLSIPRESVQEPAEKQKKHQSLVLKHWRPTYWSGDCLCRLRSNHLQVSVQRHRMDTQRKFREVHFKFRTSQELREEILARTWTFLGPGDGKKGYGTLSDTPEGKWDSTATKMVERFKETGPVFHSISALSRRGILHRKSNRDTILFNADATNTELLFRTIHWANQLSICGAVLIWCEEFGLRPNEREGQM